MGTVAKVLEAMLEADTSALTTAIGWIVGSLGMASMGLALLSRIRRLEGKVSDGNAGDGV